MLENNVKILLKKNTGKTVTECGKIKIERCSW